MTERIKRLSNFNFFSSSLPSGFSSSLLSGFSSSTFHLASFSSSIIFSMSLEFLIKTYPSLPLSSASAEAIIFCLRLSRKPPYIIFSLIILIFSWISPKFFAFFNSEISSIVGFISPGVTNSSIFKLSIRSLIVAILSISEFIIFLSIIF